MGGSSIIVENRYAKQVCEEFKLKWKPKSKPSLGVWDFEKQEFIVHMSRRFFSDLWQNLLLLYKYKKAPWDAKREVKKTVKKFTNIYELQDKYYCWETHEELFNKLGIYDLTQKSLEVKGDESIIDFFNRITGSKSRE